MSDSIRFGVKNSTGCRSSSWKLWKHRNDIYLSSRPLRGTVKVSLHESGIWQVSFTSEFSRKAGEYFDTKSRHILRLQKPSDVEPGVTVACRIHIPISELRMLDEESGKNAGHIQWVNAPGDDLSIQFLVVISEKIAQFREWPGEADPATQALGRISMHDGQSIWVLWREQPVNPDVKRHIDFGRSRVDRGFTLQSNGLVDFTRDSLRLVIFASDELGAVVLIEAALNKKSQD
jgi:hypothetical protein